MNVSELARIGLHHVKNSFAEELYLKTGIDRTKPISIYAEIIEKCNYKCRYCDYWRRPNYRDEMTIDQWKTALMGLRDFIGHYHIEFSGGEPYIKKGIMDLIRYLGEEDVKWGITTNGAAFGNLKIVEQTVAARPFNINISIDSHIAATHDHQRGMPGSLDAIVKGVQNLRDAQKRLGIEFPIIIKSVVTSQNFRHLPDMVQWAMDIGGTAVNYQPVDPVSEEVDQEFWIGEDLMPELIEVTDRLRQMKRDGAPILATDLLLSLYPAHFRNESAPKEAMPCRIGLRNFFIRSDGRVETCWYFEPIGHLLKNTPEEIWNSEAAKINRAETVKCEKLCLFTCLSQKNISDKVKMGMQLLKKAA
jgi:MoaA/NifB/PqqE/SkfB family radical SAM enzyme